MEEGSLFHRMKQIFHEDEMDEEMQKEAAGLIRNIFRYMDKDAKDIMTHRKNIVAIDGEQPLEDALKFMLDERFSRFPVYHEDIDEIIGIIHLRDAMSGYLDEAKRNRPMKELKDYIRPVTYIPETKSIDTLFKEMQSAKNHMVIVLDEYGQTSGLVAMEDILEEIVGNILDEYDEEDEMIQKQNDGSVIANGMTELEDLEDLIPVTFEKEDYETLNGFLIDELEHIPGEDERCVVDYEGYGPNGTAIIVETLTDNKNRTASNVKNAFTKGNGNVGTPGCVSFMFDKKGQIVIDKEEYEGDADELMMQVLDAGAEDFVEEEDSFEVLTDPDDFSAVRLAMEEAGIPMASAEVTMIPQTYVELTDAKDIANIQKTLDMLDDDDDVQDVYHNWDE